MSSSIVERLTSGNRWIGLGVVVFLSVGIIGLGVWLMASGDDEVKGDDVPAWMLEEGEAFDPEAEAGADVLPGSPVVPDAALIAESVQATIEAIPTATPLPTPDIGATLQAELTMNRQEVQPVLLMNPMDSETSRNPYLTPGELDYFREFGPRLWFYTKTWFHLQEVISEDVVDWTLADVRHDLGRAQVLLDTAPDRPRLSSDDSVGPVVRAYSDSLESSFSGVRSSVARLADADAILSSGAVGNAEREELIRIVLDIEGYLGVFDETMSTYGCSVCGELFRRELP